MYIRKISILVARNAGHSKWQNIRHTKALKDLEKSALFSRIGQKIKVAITGMRGFNVYLFKAIYYCVVYPNNNLVKYKIIFSVIQTF